MPIDYKFSVINLKEVENLKIGVFGQSIYFVKSLNIPSPNWS